MRPLVAVGLAMAYIASLPGMAYAQGNEPSPLGKDAGGARDYCDDLFTENKIDGNGLLECHLKVGEMEDEIKDYILRAARLGHGIKHNMSLLTKLSPSLHIPSFRFPPTEPPAGQDRTAYNKEKAAYDKALEEEKDLVAKCTEERTNALVSIDSKINYFKGHLFPDTEKNMPKITKWESYKTTKKGVLQMLSVHRGFAEKIRCKRR